MVLPIETLNLKMSSCQTDPVNCVTLDGQLFAMKEEKPIVELLTMRHLKSFKELSTI